MAKTYYIVGRLKQGPKEIIDQTDSYPEAAYLLGEYRLAFQGQGWTLSVTSRKPKGL